MAEAKTSRFEILEDGNVYFLYRPKVEDEDVAGVDDVQRVFMVLAPRSRKLFRLIVIGRKHLPDIGDHERTWSFVETVAESGKALEEGLRAEEYGTETRGERHQPAARPAGEGVYAILFDPEAAGGGDMRLAYALELPGSAGPVQKALNIAPEASFVISIANPHRDAQQAGLPKDRRAHYPKSLQEAFRGRRFATENAQLLDYEGAEIVFVGARRHPERRYDVDLEAEDESPESAEIFRELRFAKSRHPVEPLLSGHWD